MDPDGRENPARPDGRRRARDRVLAWAPGLTQSQATPKATPNDRAPLKDSATPNDRAPDAGRQPNTFGELDLVITPVSVTPPRTWRRAAWFSVAASCVVLTVLVFAAARLAERPFDRIDAFPGLPTGGLLTAQPLGPPVHPEPVTTTPADQDSPSVVDGRPGETAGGAPGGDQPGTDRGEQGDGTQPVTTTAEEPHGELFAEPTVTVKPTTGRPPPVSADDLLTATRTFYGHLPNDVDNAWGMVGPRVKVKGYENFRKQWGNAAEVHLQQVVVDADNGTVLATVQLVETDGTEHVQRFELKFRKGNSLIIDEITPLAESDGREPGR